MRLDITAGQAGWLMMKVAPAAIKYLTLENPTDMQRATYERIIKPLFDQLDSKLGKSEVIVE